MCCDDFPVDPAVTAMLDRYRALQAERGFDWAQDWAPTARLLLRGLSVCEPGKLLQALPTPEETSPEGLADPIGLLVSLLPEVLPSDVCVITATQVRLPEQLPYVIEGRPLTLLVFHVGSDPLRSQLRTEQVTVDDPTIIVHGHRLQVAHVSERAVLHLTSDDHARWSVADDRGGAWFPDNVLRKYGWRRAPYFHAAAATVSVPSAPIAVSAARGCEFETVSRDIEALPQSDVEVRLNPARIFDAASRGWYGGDCHVHLNYYGDEVATLADAAAMQRGEGLHLMNLVSGNLLTSFVYDQEGFEAHLEQDLPWSTSEFVARWGVEYRNDLLGHFHTLGATRTPKRYYAGHRDSDNPYDWPPNFEAAQDFRDAGASVGYTHPVFQPMGENGSPAPVFCDDRVRSVEARELVVDAALGLVDSVDVGGVGDLDGTTYLYHRLLGCGIRLAATAGTDTMLSNLRNWPLSNPPGWFRAYVELGDQPLSAEAWQQAVRSGRTFVTNGPWLEIDVNGCGIGQDVDLDERDVVRVSASSRGPGVESLTMVSAYGILAEKRLPNGSDGGRLDIELPISSPTWLAAIAAGPEPHAALGPRLYAHTSPIWINLRGQGVRRARDATWCLDWITRLEAFVHKHGRFDSPEQLLDLQGGLERARSFYANIVMEGQP